jgi:hypothetical protein
MKVFAINIEEQPVKTRHICWFIRRTERDIILCEVVESSYRHPEAPEHALISRIETEDRAAFNLSEAKAAPLLLLEQIQTTNSLLFKREG